MNHSKPTWKRIVFSILIGLAAIPGAYLQAALPMLCAVMAFVAAAWGGVCFAVSLGTAAAALTGFFGAAGLFELAVLAPAALVLGYCLSTGKPYRTAAAGTAAALAAGYYCAVCLPSVLAGNGPFAAMEETFTAMAETVAQTGAQLVERGLADSAALETLNQAMGTLSLLAPEITCFSIACLAMGFGLLDVLLARRMALAAKVQLRPMAPFPLWQLSKNYTILSGMLLAAAFAVLLLDLSNASALLVLAECVVFLPLMLMGVCFLDFLTRVTQVSHGALRRAVTYVCIVLLLPYSAVFLLVIGFVDRFSRIRKRYRRNDRQR